jgi:hypothetical protein
MTCFADMEAAYIAIALIFSGGIILGLVLTLVFSRGLK